MWVTVLSAALVAISCALLVKILWPIWRFIQLSNNLPGPRGITNIRYLIEMASRPDKVFKIFRSLSKQYRGDAFRLWFGSTVVVCITNPEDADIILAKERQINRDIFGLRIMRKVIGTGLLTCKTDIWKEKHKAISRAFHGSIILTYIEVFNRNANDLVKNLQEFSDGKTFDVYLLIGRCTLNGIRDNAVGTDDVPDKNHDDIILTILMELPQICIQFIRKPWLMIDVIYNMSKLGRKLNKVYDALCGMSSSTIMKKLQKYQEKENISEESEYRKKSFLDCIITSANDINSPQTQRQLQEDLNSITIAGQETTATSLCFTLMMLALHPDLQDGICQELEDVFSDDWERPVTFDDIQRFYKMNRFIKEVLRMFHPVGLIPRTTNKEIKLTNCTLPSGCDVWVCPYFMQRDPRYFPNPERFDPDRFLPERLAERPSYSYIPFGAGPRNCVGYKYAESQMPTILSHILRKYKILPAVTLEEMQDLELSIVVKPTCGFKIKILPR